MARLIGNRVLPNTDPRNISNRESVNATLEFLEFHIDWPTRRANIVQTFGEDTIPLIARQAFRGSVDSIKLPPDANQCRP